MRELDHKEGWMPKNWCFGILVLKTLNSPLDSKEIKAVKPKGDQPWVFIGRSDAEAEAAIPWPPDVKNQLTGKELNARKHWGQEKQVLTEDEMVGWHHRLNGYEFEQTQGDSKGQGSLACYSPGGQKAGHDLATEKEQINIYTLLLLLLNCFSRVRLCVSP